MKNENGKSNNGASQIPAWWQEVPVAEKAVIRELVKSFRGLKSSRSGPAAVAARKWERSLICFIKFRLAGGARKPGAPARRPDRGSRMAATQNVKQQQATSKVPAPGAAAVAAAVERMGWDGAVMEASPEQWAKLEIIHGLDLALTPLFVVEPGPLAEATSGAVVYLNPRFGFGKN